MMIMLILTFFNVYKFGKNDNEKQQQALEKEFKEIKGLEEKKDLRQLYLRSDTYFLLHRLILFSTKLSNETSEGLKEYLLPVTCRVQSCLEKVFLHYKKNDPNDKYYKTHNINIQLYLDNFKITNISNLWYYTVLALVFLGGFFISIMISHVIKNKKNT
ncbi:hypothetical protein TUBRATIS_18960 [Tubulinosema ratisbonensis]|uniref:Uncharacterized protein n=1 Tax=Tubulinosema ratisbonensis TaxID=291195 RepID=A0A437AKA7_9MICR|nr:hypothetical protein TUBRATIS_18960 [Tubulinosema ratisbonensis]